MLFSADAINGHTSLAFVDGRAIAFAQAFWHGDVVILGGCGVLKEHRGLGAFRAPVKHRFDEARAHGLRAATIQAYEDTSAPILARLGFEERGRLVHYIKEAAPA